MPAQQLLMRMRSPKNLPSIDRSSWAWPEFSLHSKDLDELVVLVEGLDLEDNRAGSVLTGLSTE